MLLQPYKHRSDELSFYSYGINNTKDQKRTIDIILFDRRLERLYHAIKDTVLMSYSKIKLKPWCPWG